jgi:anti-sigma B factor antagonist
VSQLAHVEAESRRGLCVVRVRGEVDISNAAEVSDAIDRAVTNDGITVVLDLSGTTYLDSSGIQLLIQLAERLADRRHQLRLVVPEDSAVRALLDLTALDQVITVVARVEDAT